MRLRLQAKYALMFGSITLAVSIILAALFFHLARQAADQLHHESLAASSRVLMREFESHGRNIVLLLRPLLVEPLQSGDISALHTRLETALALPDVKAVRVFDAGANVLYDSTRLLSGFGTATPPEVRARVLSARDWHLERGPDTTAISVPVLGDGRILGGITVTFDHGHLEAEIDAQHHILNGIAADSTDRMLMLIAAILPLMLMCAASLGMLSARRLTRPIEHLHRTTGRIANGRFDLDWPRERDDELGELAEGLKKMVLQLKTKTVSMAYLDDIIGSMFDCLVVTESHGRIEKVNAATCRLTGYASHELVNRPFARLLTPSGQSAVETPTGMTLHGTAFNTIYSRDGAAINVQMSSATMVSHVDGNPRTVTVFRDVADQEAREAELRYAKEEAEVANASKSQFLANMSHELRTPLNAIIGFSSMIKDEIKGALSDTYRAYAEDIHDSAHHLLAIINDILDISKLEAGKMDLFEEEIGLDELVPSVLRIVRHRAEERGIAIAERVPEGLPDIRVDQRMMKQILINLVSNAVKFNKDNGRVDIAAAMQPDGGMKIEVADTGIGMKPADIPRLLEPFAQADASLNRTYEGTGLGLAITKSMIELHGGSIAVDSAIGAGTRITIRLPADRIVAPAAQQASSSSPSPIA